MTFNIEIFGLPIPDAGPIFAAALVIHILSGLTAVIAGALAATARKRAGRHPRAGRVYLWALGGIFATATIMAAIRWHEDAHLFAIATAGGTLATTGRLMRWLPETGPRRALAATIAIAMLCLIIDLTMITIVMVSGAPTRPLMIIAFAASLTRIVSSTTTVRHANLMRVR